MLLFVHVLLHPLVHAMGASAPDHLAVSTSSTQSDGSLNAGDRCELCRVGHRTIVTPQLPMSELLNPKWISTALHSVNYESLQADHRLPSRAPPSL
jgi:hypothetical protein